MFMCNTCCDNWNTWNTRNGGCGCGCGCNSCNSGSSLFDILFGCPCRRCRCCHSCNSCNSCGCHGNTVVFSNGRSGGTTVVTNGCNRSTTVFTNNGNNGGCGCDRRRISVPITGRISFDWPFAQPFAQSDAQSFGRCGEHCDSDRNGDRGDDFDAYYARQYGLFPFNSGDNHGGCGCGN